MIDSCLFGLPERAVHIWTLCTEASPTLDARFDGLLSPDENYRAWRFRFHRDCSAFMITRGSLRCLLGRYVDLPPISIKFKYGRNGKPLLASADGMDFSVTHSGGLAAFAFTRRCRIGVDLETIRPMSDLQAIADRFFCPEEASEIMLLPPSEREGAFFRCWTRKEAYIKATGDGLSASLGGFRVTLLPHEPARFVNFSHDATGASAWSLHDLRLAPGYSAAAAYEDEPRDVSIFPILDATELLSSLKSSESPVTGL